jgi:hypothetical protein
VEAGVVEVEEPLPEEPLPDDPLPEEPFVEDSFFVAPSLVDAVLAPFFDGSLFEASEDVVVARLSLR